MTHQQIKTRLRTFAHANKSGNFTDVYLYRNGLEIQIQHIFLNHYPNDGGFILEAEGIAYWPAGNPDEFELIENMEVSE
jgi:hypothetical protein